LPLFRILFAACLAPSFAFAACAVHPLADLPLTVAHQKLLLPVAIDGSPEQIALDTGAGITVISTEAANRLDILHDFDHHAELGGVGGADSMLYIGRVNRFDLGPLHLEHQRFPIVDLALRSDAGSAVAGFLGADILRNFDVEIDIGEGRLAIWPPATCGNTPPSWAQGIDPVTIDIDQGGHILLPIRIEGVALTGVLDTGADGLAVTSRATLRSGVSEDDLAADPELRGTGVNNRAWHGHLHRFHTIQFAGATFNQVVAGIIPSSTADSYDSLLGADALLGVRLLRHTRLWISYRTRTLYVLPTDKSAAD
jgi:predicted aspartyl protease